MTPESMAEAHRLLAGSQATAFSVDLFDTLLLRRCTRPDGVYSRAFDHAPIAADRRFLREAFVQHRHIAEGWARQHKMERAGVAEATIDEIYGEFPLGLFGLTAADRPALAAAEFRAEQDLCRINPEVLALLRVARDRGLTIGFVSDTYWSARQLMLLLDGVAPGLDFDFLYASCEHGRNKASGLFSTLLRQQGWAPRQLIHLGDNPLADGQAPAELGIATIAYPQFDQAFGEVLRGEDVMARLLRAEYGHFEGCCDGGRRILRRQVAARLPADDSPFHRLGATVIGPLFAAFHRFAAHHVAEIRAAAADERRVGVGFIARDGFLPKRVWEASGEAPLPLLRLNRHLAVLASVEDFSGLDELFREIPLMGLESVENFLRLKLPQAAATFQARPHGVMAGREVPALLPQWLSLEQLRSLAATARGKLLDYLRRSIDGFDQLSDLVLLDLGYYGNIQKYLRRVFDRLGLSIRLHGVYLATVDYSFFWLPAGDSVVGFIDDRLVGPAAKTGILRNIAVIEQFCSEPVGSVGDYVDGRAQNQPDWRDPQQLRQSGEVRQGCLDFLTLAAAVAAAWGEDPLADISDEGRFWTLVPLARLLLLPTPAERDLLRGFHQDVNLGSSTQISMLAPAETANAWNSLPFVDLCQMREPPMWLAGGLTEHQPVAGLAYTMAAFGFASADLFAETAVARLQATLIFDNGSQTAVPASLQTTPFGELRLRVPVIAKHGGSVLAIPLDGRLRCGLLRGCLLQGGDSIAQALSNRIVTPLPPHHLNAVKALLDGNYFRATEAGAHLLVSLPRFAEKLAVLTLSLIADRQDGATS